MHRDPEWLDLRSSLVTGVGLPALFVGARGERISPPVVRRALKLRALQRGISSHVYPHRLRHSFASHVLQSSQDLRAVQELMGHASIASTRVYASGLSASRQGVRPGASTRSQAQGVIRAPKREVKA